jgi:hypothetical protein
MELACKPDSVFVRRFIYAANPEGPRATSSPPYLALLPAGFARRPVTRRAGELLPHHFTFAGEGARLVALVLRKSCIPRAASLEPRAFP